MSKVESKEIPSVAFSIGGLGGNNAFGAGFLQAALDNDVKPAMITCTSGQILWVSKNPRAPPAASPPPHRGGGTTARHAGRLGQHAGAE